MLIWNTFPTASFTPADLVLGQSDFTHYQANDLDQDDTQDTECSDRTFNYVTGIYLYETLLFVADNNNNRFLIFQAQ
ncbi:hypothetical protein KKD52_11440 [Myxococcota bacterium]|nr:hypothetical protein [Myxococcota bacterium]MBU1510966.1 hypothetical protein [Myxococcota bacterium]